jgi:hypothetical protein
VERARQVLAGGDHRVGARDVGACEVNGVLRRLEERDGAAEVVQGGERVSLFE